MEELQSQVAKGGNIERGEDLWTCLHSVFAVISDTRDYLHPNTKYGHYFVKTGSSRRHDIDLGF